MSCDVVKARQGLENEMWRRWSEGMSRAHRYRDVKQSSFSNLSVTSPKSQLILQSFRCFTYVTAHSPILPLLHLRHSSFSNPSFASLTLQALHLIHLASRPCLFGFPVGKNVHSSSLFHWGKLYLETDVGLLSNPGVHWSSSRLYKPTLSKVNLVPSNTTRFLK